MCYDAGVVGSGLRHEEWPVSRGVICVEGSGLGRGKWLLSWGAACVMRSGLCRGNDIIIMLWAG